MSKAPTGFALIILACLAVWLPHEATASSSTPNRIFYLGSAGTQVTPTTPGTLTSAFPPGSCSACSANLTTKALGFILTPSFQSPATLNPPVTISLWINWKSGNSGQPSVQGAFSYHLPGVMTWANTNFTQRFFFGLTNVNITLPITATPMIEQSSMAIEISAVGLPSSSNATLSWGSANTPSLIIVPISGYQALFPVNSITIEDRSQNPASYFYLNAPSPTNVVVVKVFVFSALGPLDILKVNMTIKDPNNRPVRSAANQTMASAGGNSPYAFIIAWVYPNNSTEGTYQILVSIVDIQGNVAYTSLPATFGLVPPGFIPFPYNLIPYFIVAGVAAGGGVGGGILFRKRRGKSYLVPFDYFNNLTGGALNGGTAVTVEGNTGSGKTLLLEQLMAEDLRNSRPCVYVTTGEFPNGVRATMKSIGLDITGYEQSGLVTFVDGYSAEAGQESREKVSIPSLGDLTTLGIKISSALPSPSFKGGSLYFDSLTPLASKAKPESIVSLVQSISAKVKGLSGKAFFSMGLGLDDTVKHQLEDSADCIVQMEAFEESGTRKRRLRIAKLRTRKHLEGWTLFTIEDGKGIIFYSKKPQQ